MNGKAKVSQPARGGDPGCNRWIKSDTPTHLEGLGWREAPSIHTSMQPAGKHCAHNKDGWGVKAGLTCKMSAPRPLAQGLTQVFEHHL